MGFGVLHIQKSKWKPVCNNSNRMAKVHRIIGLVVNNINKLFTGEAVSYIKLRSREHDLNFNVQDAELQLFKEQGNLDKRPLSLNGMNITD